MNEYENIRLRLSGLASKCVRSSVSLDVVKEYIENQKGK